MEGSNRYAIYFAQLILRDFFPFGDEQSIAFIINNEDNKVIPAQWTVLLGNNNTGKTRILRSIANTLNLITQDKKVLKDRFSNWANENMLSFIEAAEEMGIKIENNEESFAEEVSEIATKKILQAGAAIGSLIIKNDFYTSIGQGNYWPALKNKKNANSFSELGGQYGIIDGCGYGITAPDKYNILVVGYGVNRRASKSSMSNNTDNNLTDNLFDENSELINIEDWLMQTDYASKNGITDAGAILTKIKTILTSGILPYVLDFRIRSEKRSSSVKNFVEFSTDYGWSSLDKLGYGYQSSISWILDLAKRMFDFYSQEDNPLLMPAIVLIDEIDLHLHPEWQRKIINHLSLIFPNVQFIVSAHSPLVIQSADKINLVLLRKEKDHVNVSQPNIPTFKGWSVEEILSELMGLDEKTYSDSYLSLMKEFDESLDNDDYESADRIYKQLNIILHPESNQRKLLRIQMASLSPAQ